MAPVIRIDDEVYAWLQKQVTKPFEDTPNSVLRGIAGLDSTKTDPAKQRTFSRDEEIGNQQKTPQNAYREPLLKILKKHGGQAPRNQVLKELELMMGGRFTPHDRKNIRSGALRWERTAEWEVHVMRGMRGGQLIQPTRNTAHGVWALTPKGMDLARTL